MTCRGWEPLTQLLHKRMYEPLSRVHQVSRFTEGCSAVQGSQGEIYSLSQDTVYPSSIMSPVKPSIDSPFAAMADAPIAGGPFILCCVWHRQLNPSVGILNWRDRRGLVKLLQIMLLPMAGGVLVSGQAHYWDFWGVGSSVMMQSSLSTDAAGLVAAVCGVCSASFKVSWECPSHCYPPRALPG